MQHPDLAYAQRLFQRYLGEERGLEGWVVKELQFDRYQASYNVAFSKGESIIRVRIPTELVDSASSSDKFKSRRLRKSIKKTLTGSV